MIHRALALFLSFACAAGAAPLAVQFEPGFPERPQRRILDHLANAWPEGVRVLAPGQPASAAPEGSAVLAFGDTAAACALIGDPEVARLPGEAFVLRAQSVDGHRVFAARGNAPGLASAHLGQGRSGVLFGAYALLEALGCAFLRPLAAAIPGRLTLPQALDRTEAPALR